MRHLKFAILGASALALLLCFVYKLPSAGAQGWVTIALAAVPGIIAAVGIKVWRGLGRGPAAGCLVAFLVVGMKTSGDDTDLQNIMMVAFLGMLLSVALLVKPDRAKT
ncbi:MAG: hypothetical protein R3B06_02535 [Kofleriaceae bacterium]